MNENNGWITLHRKLLKNPICEKPDYLSVWIHLLLMANHEETSFIWNNKRQILKAGQLLTGRKKLSKITRVKESQIYKILNYLELEQQIKQEKTTKYTVITILNWHRYQDKKEKKNNNATTTQQQSNTYNNVNNDNKISKDRATPVYGNKDLISLGTFLKNNYPKPLMGITDTRKLQNLKQVMSKRKNQDEWMDDNWKENVKKFMAMYLEETEEIYLVNSVEKLKEKAKLWREYRGKLS